VAAFVHEHCSQASRVAYYTMTLQIWVVRTLCVNSWTAQLLKPLVLAHLDVGLYTEWPKKVSHYQVTSLNRIKNIHYGYIFHKFW